MFTTLAIAAAQAHPWGPGAGGFGWLWLLFPLFWIGVFVLIAVLLGRRWRRGDWGPGSRFAAASAEATLADRYARGDIDEKEYRARLEVLRSSGGGR